MQMIVGYKIDIMKLSMNTVAWVSCICLLSCSKSDKPAGQSVREQIQNKDWKVSALTITPAYNGSTDYYHNTMLPCERDNIYKFAISFSAFILDVGVQGCNIGDPISGTQEGIGTWNYDESQNLLHFDVAGSASFNYNMTLDEVEDDHFKGTTTEIISGITYTKKWEFHL